MSKIIIRGYSQAGDEFLAEKLKKIFSELTTPEDVALHNDMLKDIQAMVGGDGAELRKAVARMLLTRPRKFLQNVANTILTLSLRNRTDGQTQEKKTK
jgi:hypothetical protein